MLNTVTGAVVLHITSLLLLKWQHAIYCSSIVWFSVKKLLYGDMETQKEHCMPPFFL